MAQMFLCYAREDEVQVRELYGRLKGLGFELWMDKVNLLGGQRWRLEIPKALRASTLVLICLSSHSTKIGFVQREFKLALDTLQEIPDDMIHTIPVRLESCTVPAQFEDLQWVDLFETDGFERLLHAICYGLEQRGEPVPTSLKSQLVTPEPTIIRHSSLSIVTPTPVQESEDPPEALVVSRPPSTHSTPSFSTETREAQGMLKQLGFDPGPIDGIWGRKTELEVRAYQHCRGLPETGLLDDDTVASLKVETNEQQEPTLSPSFTNSIGMEFVLIPAGTFTMGSPDSDQDAGDEKPAHKVTISEPFYLGKYEVTQAQWQAVMGTNPSYFKARWKFILGQDKSNHPVESVSWDEAQQFIQKLNEKEGVTHYRLPTEAEWEYAARAGTTTRYSFGDEATQLGYYGWYRNNAGRETHPVGQKQPNAWGLYDMHGNVWEWVADWYAADYYEQSPPCDPQGPTGGGGRVLRGGGWSNGDLRLCSAYRRGLDPGNGSVSIGFRLARGQTSK